MIDNLKQRVRFERIERVLENITAFKNNKKMRLVGELFKKICDENDQISEQYNELEKAFEAKDNILAKTQGILREKKAKIEELEYKLRATEGKIK